MARFLAASLVIMLFAVVISSKLFSSSQSQPERAILGPRLAHVHAIEVDSNAVFEAKALPAKAETVRKESSTHNRYGATKNLNRVLSDTHSLTRRQRPGEILGEIARVMRDPFHDVYSFAISSAVSVSVIFYLEKIIQAIRKYYVHQPPQSRFDLKFGAMKASFNSPRHPIPWNSAENIFRNLAENVDRGFIGLSRYLLRRDDIESGADITVGEQGIIFALSMGTVLLLFYGLPDERGNFVG